MKYYDEITLSERAALSHPKAALEERNREMVDRADLIICYVNREFGGAYKAMKYAEKRQKPIINLAKDICS
ncbi:MAG: hypothetical protein IJ946_08660 [Clostridia bacterium]|nr:hypothetical protein [Clostridia bacterium]